MSRGQKIIQYKALECNSLGTLDSILAYYSTLEMDFVFKLFH